MFSFSSEEGMALICRILRGLWSYTPRDHQLEVVAKVLDGTDVLTILPTGAGKTGILIMFLLVLKHMKENPGEFEQLSARFPTNPIILVVYPTNCLEEEQVCV